MLKIVSQWSYNPPSGLWLLGTDAKDSSGNGNDGTAHGGVTFGQVGPYAGTKAVLLNGTDGEILVPNAANLNPAMGPFSIIVWLKNGGTFQNIIAKTTYTTAILIMYEGNPGILQVDLSPDNYATGCFPSASFPTMNDGLWHSGGITVDRITPPKLYGDGLPLNTIINPSSSSHTAAGMNLTDVTAQLSIGSDALGSRWNGLLAGAVWIVGTALSAAQMAAYQQNFVSDYHKFALIVRLDSNGRVYVGSSGGGDQYALSVAQQLNMNQVTAQVSGIVELQGGNQFTKTQFDAVCQSLVVPPGLILKQDIG